MKRKSEEKQNYVNKALGLYIENKKLTASEYYVECEWG